MWFLGFEFQLWIFWCETFDKCSNDFKYNGPFTGYFLFILGNNSLCGITMFVLLMNSQPQALQQLPVSVVNLVHDVQWEYDDKLKPTINFIMFDYIRGE